MSDRTLKNLLDEGMAYLCEKQIADYKIDAWYLLEEACHVRRGDYLMDPQRLVSGEEAEKYLGYIHRRGEGYPLQYITGEQEFMGIPFAVNEHVLIPRQDTEVLVETVLSNIREHSDVLDMCTGSGCILLSILALKPMASGTGVDLSVDALNVARGNEVRIRSLECAPYLPAAKRTESVSKETDCAECVGKEAADAVKAPRVSWIHSDLFENVTGTFDAIVSNPPYIPTKDIEELMTEVRVHEPRMALDGTEDGLEFYRKICAKGWNYLKDGGMIFFEIGWDQAAAVSALLEDAGFSDIHVTKDLAGLDRVVYAVK